MSAVDEGIIGGGDGAGDGPPGGDGAGGIAVGAPGGVAMSRPPLAGE
jgi:hypothetical protein